MLRAGLDPVDSARDTWAFTSGMLHLLLECQLHGGLDQEIPRMISTHMGLRRRA